MSEYQFGTHELRVREAQYRGAIWGRAQLTPNGGIPPKRIVQAGPQIAPYDQITGSGTIYRSQAIYVLTPDIPAITATYEWGTHQKAVYEGENRSKVWGSITGGRRQFLAWSFIAEGQAYTDPPSNLWTKAAHMPILPKPRSIRITGIEQQSPEQPAPIIFRQQPRGADTPPIARFQYAQQELPRNVDYSAIYKQPRPQGVPDVPIQIALIPDQIAVQYTGPASFNLSQYFSKAVTYLINPAIESSWTFSAGLLTIPTEVADTFGPYIITASNGANSVASNSFFVIVRLGSFTPFSPENDNTVEVPSNYEIDDRTGFRMPRGALVKQWDGAMVRPKSWESRHPQDFVRGVPERQKGSPRPEQIDRFIDDDEQVDPEDL